MLGLQETPEDQARPQPPCHPHRGRSRQCQRLSPLPWPAEWCHGMFVLIDKQCVCVCIYDNVCIYIYIICNKHKYIELCWHRDYTYIFFQYGVTHWYVCIYIYIIYIYFASSHIGAGRSKLRLHDLPLNMIYKHVLHNPHPGFLVVSNWDKQPNMESKIYSQMLTCWIYWRSEDWNLDLEKWWIPKAATLVWK